MHLVMAVDMKDVAHGESATVQRGLKSSTVACVGKELCSRISGGLALPAQSIERSRALSRTIVALSLALSLAAIAMSSWALMSANRAVSAERVITAKGLIIQDASGTARVVIGAPVPDPVVLGEVGKRAAPASGLLLLGPDGNERGGYLTVDQGGEAVLTLDSADGSAEVFKVVANEDAGASLFVLHRNGAGAMVTTYQGHPELQLIDSEGVARFSQPEAMARQR